MHYGWMNTVVVSHSLGLIHEVEEGKTGFIYYCLVCNRLWLFAFESYQPTDSLIEINRIIGLPTTDSPLESTHVLWCTDTGRAL